MAKINQQTGMVRFGDDGVEQQNGQGSGSGSASASASTSASSSSGAGNGSLGVDGGMGRRQQQQHRDTSSEMLLHTLEGHITYPITHPLTYYPLTYSCISHIRKYSRTCWKVLSPTLSHIFLHTILLHTLTYSRTSWKVISRISNHVFSTHPINSLSIHTIYTF